MSAKMTKTELAALKECEARGLGMPEGSKPKTMKGLAAKGLVQREPSIFSYARYRWRITEAGRLALAEAGDE